MKLKISLFIFACFTGVLSFKLNAASIFSETNLPRFEDYFISESFKGTPKALVLNSHSDGRKFRTVLSKGAKEGPNYAGHYTIVPIGCGTMCQIIWLINAKTGKIILNFVSTSGASYRLNSKLLVINPVDELTKEDQISLENSKTHYYVLDNNKVKEIYNIDTIKLIK